MAVPGRAQLCDRAQETSCFPSPVGCEMSSAPCSVRGHSHGARPDGDLCRSRKLSSSSSPTCLPFASAKGFPHCQRTQSCPATWWLLPMRHILPPFQPQGRPRCRKVDEDFPLGATKPPLTLVGSVPAAVGFGFASGMV